MEPMSESALVRAIVWAAWSRGRAQENSPSPTHSRLQARSVPHFARVRPPKSEWARLLLPDPRAELVTHGRGLRGGLTGGGKSVWPQIVAHVLSFQPLQYRGKGRPRGRCPHPETSGGLAGQGVPGLAVAGQAGTPTTQEGPQRGPLSLPPLRQYETGGLPPQPWCH